MILSDTAIKRPVFTTMIMVAIMVFGAISYFELGVDLYPRVEMPTITVVSVLPGADPETIETTVTDPIEDAVSTVSGIEHLRSTSAEGVSQVIVQFELAKDVDVAYQEIQAKIGTVRSELPRDLEDPVVEKFDIDASPIMAIVVSGDMPLRELTRIADKVVKARVQQIRNVGQVKLVGQRDRQVWLWLDRDQLAGYSLSVGDVEQALRSEHVELPGGRIETGEREYVVKTKAEFRSASELADMVVTYQNGAPVRVRDLGWVEDGLEEERSLARLDDKRAVSLLIRRQSGTNTLEVADAVMAEVQSLRVELASQGVRLEIAQDRSAFIEHSVGRVREDLVLGGVLAILVVFVFLGNIRSSIITALVIPTAVIGTFSMMRALGFTQNMMTMLGLTLSIGLLIDDSIVVQENTMRHVEEGKPAREAASFATNEIALAVLATTLSVVAVFVPVAFMKGIVGRFFYQFGLTVAFAVMISLFVSFTLDPMLSSRFLKLQEPGRFARLFNRLFGGLERSYEALLRGALRARWLVVVLALAAMLSAGYLAQFTRSEFMTVEDQSEFNVKVKAPLGSSLAYTDKLLERIRGRVSERPWVQYCFVTVGADALQRVNEGVLYVRMTEKDERTLGQLEAMDWVREQVAGIDEAKVSVEVVPRVAGGGRVWAELQLEVRGDDLNRLDAIVSQITQKMRATPGYVDIDTTYEKAKPEVNVYVRRDRAHDLGVSPSMVASTVKALVGGSDVTKFRADGDRYDVSVRLQRRFRDRPADLRHLSVRSTSGQLVSLENVAEVKEESGPVQIDRYNRSRKITILANLKPELKVLGEATEEVVGFAHEAGLPAGYTLGFAGNADMMAESFFNMLFALGLAIGMVYMVLASQFESFLHPLTIMVSLPLSMVGALGALVLTGQTVSIFTMIGFIMLMGLVTKNAILLVDYTNTLRERDGVERDAAVLKAGPVRLRPILMTTIAMIFGMLPIALGTGPGSESRAPMATAIIGGLITSTLLTLVVVPVVYTLIDDMRHPSTWRLVSWFRAGASSEPESRPLQQAVTTDDPEESPEIGDSQVS